MNRISETQGAKKVKSLQKRERHFQTGECSPRGISQIETKIYFLRMKLLVACVAENGQNWQSRSPPLNSFNLLWCSGCQRPFSILVLYPLEASCGLLQKASVPLTAPAEAGFCAMTRKCMKKVGANGDSQPLKGGHMASSFGQQMTLAPCGEDVQLGSTATALRI